MPSTIWSCPSCKSLILQDTVQCPECNHILDNSRYEEQGGTAAGLSGAPVKLKQDACPTCGELVRHGLVRCWNCGSFMRDDVADLYRRMQAKPAPVIYSNVPDAEPIYSVEDPEDLVISSGDADDDFELASEISAHRSAASGQQGASQTARPPAARSSSDSSSSDTYTLADSKPAAETPNIPVPETPIESPGKPLTESAKNQPTDSGAVEESKAEAAAEQTASAADDSAAAPHSVATGGDALLEIALEEELEADRRRQRAPTKKGKSRTITGFLVFCPNGHRIEVQGRHRGKAGRCPKCKALFIVPDESRKEPQSAAAEGGEPTAGADPSDEQQAAGAFARWMTDVHLHTVNPEKLRLKPGSLEKSFQEVDVGFSTDGILIATLVASRGLLGIGGDKKESARAAMMDRLREEVPIDDLPVADKQLLDNQALGQLSIDQPVIYEHESMFVGVPVFGEGRIAVRLPKTQEGELPRFLSFELSGFRVFAKNLEEMFGISEFGALNEIPLADEFSEQTCHYSEEAFRSLERVEFYQADPAYKLNLVGRKCEACGLVVSETSRKREKIGGSMGRGIAKAKCPKCGEKFGDISLYDLEEPAPAAEPEPAQAEPATNK